jgi:hypothetical protein
MRRGKKTREIVIRRRIRQELELNANFLSG